MKIGIIGNYGATNIGDDAILTALLKSLSRHEVTVFSADSTGTHQNFGVKSVPLFPLGFRSLLKFRFHRSIQAVKNMDVIILGGGGLFQDSYLYACLLWAWQIFWVTRFKKPFFVYGTGVGPLKTRLGKIITKWAHNYASLITVRDKISADTLGALELEPEIITTADPAFLYKEADISKERVKNRFIISVRPWLNQNLKIINAFTVFLEKIKTEKHDAEFIFVSMQQVKEHDRRVIDFILKKTGGELYIPLHFSDLVHTMKMAEFAIGMRYHFLIAALITKTPALPVSYSPKVDELFRDTPLEKYIIPVNNLSAKTLEDKLKLLSVDYNNVQIYEKAQSSKLEELAQKNVNLFIEYIKSFDQKEIE